MLIILQEDFAFMVQTNKIGSQQMIQEQWIGVCNKKNSEITFQIIFQCTI